MCFFFFCYPLSCDNKNPSPTSGTPWFLHTIVSSRKNWKTVVPGIFDCCCWFHHTVSLLKQAVSPVHPSGPMPSDPREQDRHLWRNVVIQEQLLYPIPVFRRDYLHLSTYVMETKVWVYHMYDSMSIPLMAQMNEFGFYKNSLCNLIKVTFQLAVNCKKQVIWS